MNPKCPRCSRPGYRDYEGYYCFNCGSFGEKEHYAKPLPAGTVKPCPHCQQKYIYQKRLKSHITEAHPEVA